MTGAITGVAILGSTGSIGTQTLAVVRALPERFRVVGLAAGRATPGLEAQAAEWPDARIHCRDDRPSWVPRARWAASLKELAVAGNADLVVVATTGMTALPAVLAVLAAGQAVALANKETLVAGGHLVTALLDGLEGDPLARLRPVDSEHSAIWQCLQGERREDVARLILTASGGPFLDREIGELGRVSPAEALAHPTWRMGDKITIDSATMVNKAFEAIEAQWLYRLPYSRIAAVIHPRSVVHSLVEFVDGSYKAQLGFPDMRLPIQYALTYPGRLASPVSPSDPTAWGTLEFRELDEDRFPAYRVTRQAAAAGGNRGTILNAADEVAIDAFLDGRIGFDRIAGTLEEAVARWGDDREPDVDGIMALDAEVRGSLRRSLATAGR